MWPEKVSGPVPKRSYLGTPATAPGPAGPQMFKAFGQIRNNPLMYLNRVWQEYGDVVQFPIPRPPTYLVVDPSGVERVLLGSARYYGKSTIQYRALSLVTGEGLLTADTEAWRRQRPMVQPAFHHESLAEIAAHIGVAIDRISTDWRRAGSGTVIDVDAAMMHGALEVVGHALFGTDLSRDAEQLASATLSALDVVIARARVPVSPPDWVPTPANRILRRANGQLDAAVHAMIQERRAKNRNPPSDMLDILLSVRDDHGVGLTEIEIRNQMVTFIVAGHETVASALTWAWGLLAANPGWQKRMQAEIDEVIGGRQVTFADYANLPVTRAIFDEVLRMYPPAWLITRKALVDDVLGGCEIPAGALIILSPYLLH
ncbi:MAG: cytochrome P450, partial [Actinobacteria bacterium]|nr:cytochrome P450 [Actinomycetota bacterium]